MAATTQRPILSLAAFVMAAETHLGATHARKFLENMPMMLDGDNLTPEAVDGVCLVLRCIPGTAVGNPHDALPCARMLEFLAPYSSHAADQWISDLFKL